MAPDHETVPSKPAEHQATEPSGDQPRPDDPGPGEHRESPSDPVTKPPQPGQ